MTMTAPINIIDRTDLPGSSKINPHGVDRVIEGLGVALLNWSRARVARTMLSGDRYKRMYQSQSSLLQREADARRLTLRLGL